MATLPESQQCLQSSSVALQLCQMESHIGLFIGISSERGVFNGPVLACTVKYVCVFMSHAFLHFLWFISALCLLKACNILLRLLPALESAVELGDKMSVTSRCFIDCHCLITSSALVTYPDCFLFGLAMLEKKQ